MKELKSFSNHIKFTLQSNRENVNFLDVNINLSNGDLLTNMYIKPTHCHQYLDYSLSHPNHTKHFAVYSQSLRAKRLYSVESDFLKHCTKIISWFLKRGYPENRIDEKMKRVKFSGKRSKKSKESKGVPFVITYHLSLNCLSRIIKDSLNILYVSLEAETVFSPGLMVSFRGARKVSRYLVRA